MAAEAEEAVREDAEIRIGLPGTAVPAGRTVLTVTGLAIGGRGGARADQAAGGLSGGERFRAVLAALLLAQPPPQLLLLDEPTNNLDMASVRQLSQALSCYQAR